MSILVAKGDYWVGKGLARKRLAEDLAGGNHGELIGGVRFMEDAPPGGCGSIDTSASSSARVTLPNTVPFASDRLTVALWFYPRDQEGGNDVLVENKLSTIGGWRFGINPSEQLFMRVKTYSGDVGPIGSSSLAIPIAEWSYIAATYDGFEISVIVNGATVAAAEEPGLSLLSGELVHVATTVEGLVADLSFWNSALSESEIRANMHRRLVGNEPGLIGYWPLADRCPVLISSHPYKDGTLGQAQPRIPAGSDPEFRSAIAWPQHRQRAQLSYGALETIAIDGQLDHWLGGTFRGRKFELRTATRPDQPWDETELHYAAYVDHVKWLGERRVKLEFRNPAKLLQNPIQINVFPDTTPNADLVGQRKPMVVGIGEHVPALLYDAIGADEEHWYVADNYNGSWAGGNGTIHAVNEGLAEIAEGPNAGQFEYAADGRSVLLHKHPTLPLTIGWARGPRKRLIPYQHAHFGEWVERYGRIVPDGWGSSWSTFDDTRYLERFEDTDSVLIHTEFTNNYIELVPIGNPIPGPGDYVLRVRVAKVAGYSGRIHLRVTGIFSAVCDPIVVSDLYIEGSGTHDIPFTSECGMSSQSINLEWNQHPDDDAAGQPSRMRVLSIQVLDQGDVDEPWAVPHIGRTPDQIVPYLLLERGVKVQDDVELGPLRASEIDYGSLSDLTALHPTVVIGRYWQDDTTHEKMLDQIAHTFNAAWHFGRDGKLRFVPMELPELAVGTPIEIGDYNRSSELQIDNDPAEELSARIGIRRNFRTLSQGEVALTVSTLLSSRYSREWVQELSAPTADIDELHSEYEHARGAEPQETMISSTSGVSVIVTERVQAHSQVRRFTQITRVTAGEFEAVDPGALIKLQTHRFQVGAEGRPMIALDVRNLPVSSRQQLIAWS